MTTHVDHHSLFEHVYTHAPIGIALVSPDGTWMKTNPALCSILGFTQKELVGRSFMEITHPDDLQKDKDRLRELLAGELSAYETEKRYIRKNGGIIWISLHVSLVREEKRGTPLYCISHIIDISEKKAAEQKLLETEDLYNLIAENAMDVISYNSPDGICRYISPSVREVLGYEPDELIGKNTIQFYHPDDMLRLQSTPFSDNDVVTYRARHKNGRYIWFETTYRIIRDEQGKVQKVFGIGRDITERKKHEDNLAEAQRIASIGSWEWDIVNDVNTFSDEAYRIYNLDKMNDNQKPAELISLIHPEDQARFKEELAQALHGKDIISEYRHLQPDGTVKYLHIRGSVSFDDHGNPVRMNGIIQDITDHKMIQLQLQETIERYTSLKKYNHDAVISLDLEGNIINCNNVAQKLTGLDIKDMVGRNFSAFMASGNAEKILTESQGAPSFENHIDKIKHIDGHTAEVLTTVAPIIIHNQTVGYYIIAKDITEQKNLLIAKEAAETTNKAKSEFLAMMSHEIRTPMSGVIGMTELLLETTKLDPVQKEFVEIIQKSGEMLLTIINDILDFSKIESGMTKLVEEPVDLKAIIADTFDLFLSQSGEKQLEMNFSIAPDVPAALIGDPVRLKQIITNLVGNAVKFTDNGSISLSAETVYHGQGKVQLKFIVKDTGIGLPKEKLDALFEPFRQLDNFMTRKTKGSGLGLAISKKLVELMGGDIWVEQTGEQGTTFAFTVILKDESLPLSAEAGHMEAAEEAAPGKSFKMLVAEDNEINQLVLKNILTRQGHEVSIAENGKEVLQAAADEQFDMIFMDIQMPYLNGIEATKAIKEMMPPEKCPVIVAVTANALKGDMEACLAAGMHDYISKPLKSEMVLQVINRHLGDRQ